MSIKQKKLSPARQMLEELRGAPLSFGRLINSLRQNKEISQVELAKKIGITRQNLCAIEKGRRLVSPKLAAKFAKLMGYSQESFVATALEDELRREGFDYAVELRAA